MSNTPMQGTHSMWFEYYKGAVYPLDLEGEPCCKIKQGLTLLELCCSRIVKDSSLTRAAIDDVPPILCVHLMEAALKGNHDRSIQALMSRWVLKSLVLSKLVPNVFSSMLPMYDSAYQADLVRQGMRYTTSLAHIFLECLRQEAPTKLRQLDLTGFPTAEVILYYLSSHCMLVHTECRRNNMINLYNQAVNLAERCCEPQENNHESLDIDMFHCIPEDVFVEIKLDAFVTSESCHAEFCKALTVSSFSKSRLKLVIDRLSATCIGGNRVIILLKQIKPEALKGLQLKYNSLRNMDFVRMAPTLQCMTSLTSLDLSCNHICLTNEENLADVMKEAFSTLCSLERLDLSNNRLKNQLCTVLIGIKVPLKFLRLAACGLTLIDFTALCMFPFLEHLEELDISENNLDVSRYPLMPILWKTYNSLKVLELEDCSLPDDAIPMLETSFDKQSKLLYLNIAENSWNTDSMKKFVKTIAKIASLRVCRFPYPRDLIPEDTSKDLELELKESFNGSIMDIVEEHSTKPADQAKLRIIWVDLESS